METSATDFFIFIHSCSRISTQTQESKEICLSSFFAIHCRYWLVRVILCNSVAVKRGSFFHALHALPFSLIIIIAFFLFFSNWNALALISFCFCLLCEWLQRTSVSVFLCFSLKKALLACSFRPSLKDEVDFFFFVIHHCPTCLFYSCFLISIIVC